MVRPRRAGFSLVELMVTVAVAALLLVSGVPLTRAWIQSSQARDAQGMISQGISKAKALAVRNAASITNDALAMSAVCVSNGTLTVVTAANAATQANCSTSSSVVWTAQLPSGSSVQVGATTLSSLSCLAYNTRGNHVAGANSCSVPSSSMTTWKVTVAVGNESVDLVLY